MTSHADGLTALLGAWTGHVQAAVWDAHHRHASPPHEPFATAVMEALPAIPASSRAEPVPVPVTWRALGEGSAEWAALLRRSPMNHVTPHPHWRSVQAAVLLHAAADGVLAPLLGPDPATSVTQVLDAGEDAGWARADTHAVVEQALRCGWASRLDSTTLTAPALRELAGVGHTAEAAQWLRDRFRLELRWFWEPVGALPDACVTGRQPATFGADSESGRFRAESTLVNASLVPQRRHAAERLARSLHTRSRPLRILELGTGTAVWSRALADHPGSSVVSVDHPEVHVVAVSLLDDPVFPAAPYSRRYAWVSGAPSHVPQGHRFDLVVVVDLLHTLPADDVPPLFQAVTEVLSRGGRVVVVEPMLDGTRQTPSSHLWTQVKLAVTGGGRIWDAPRVRALMSDTGLRTSPPRGVLGHVLILAQAR